MSPLKHRRVQYGVILVTNIKHAVGQVPHTLWGCRRCRGHAEHCRRAQTEHVKHAERASLGRRKDDDGKGTGHNKWHTQRTLLCPHRSLKIDPHSLTLLSTCSWCCHTDDWCQPFWPIVALPFVPMPLIGWTSLFCLFSTLSARWMYIYTLGLYRLHPWHFLIPAS